MMHHYLSGPGQDGLTAVNIFVFWMLLLFGTAARPAEPVAQLRPAPTYPATVQSDYDRLLYDLTVSNWRR